MHRFSRVRLRRSRLKFISSPGCSRPIKVWCRMRAIKSLVNNNLKPPPTNQPTQRLPSKFPSALTYTSLLFPFLPSFLVHCGRAPTWGALVDSQNFDHLTSPSLGERRVRRERFFQISSLFPSLAITDSVTCSISFFVFCKCTPTRGALVDSHNFDHLTSPSLGERRVRREVFFQKTTSYPSILPHVLFFTVAVLHAARVTPTRSSSLSLRLTPAIRAYDNLI